MRKMLVLILTLHITAFSSTVTVTWFETGASTAVALETSSGKVFLIDTAGPDAAKQITTYLKERGHKRIDRILITHPHNDHIGSLAELMKMWEVNGLVDTGLVNQPAPGIHLIDDKHIALRTPTNQNKWIYKTALSGTTLDWDEDISMEVLWPVEVNGKEYPTNPKKEHSYLNNTSIILRVQHGKNVFIFAGDNYSPPRSIPPEKLRATVLTAGHHGFHAPYWNDAVNPRYHVSTCLSYYANNEGTPYTRYPGLYQMLHDKPKGKHTYSTAYDGQVTAVSDGEKIVMKTERPRTIPPPVIPLANGVAGFPEKLEYKKPITLELSVEEGHFGWISTTGPNGPFKQFSGTIEIPVSTTTTFWQYKLDPIATYSRLQSHKIVISP
ncbi:MAG: MBL fold metallo-hydrolase [Lentisphaerae bacterium]|jgi:competence protein ComEC|nr:MBL fold metallo-hydrolase [Lentisphaerota bacterium]MBT5605704.1 MBL fold metallo-hydrolase [Lentisphaerota bacterium]MBT7055441.1 MBL fold metallo-hydrolase [Lentisphaerota bacterium]MBT7844077.1 MBL fold metallo-hydrolase [Lentisphaerota bacterium]